METVTDFVFLGSKSTVDGDRSYEIKKMLAPWRKSYDKPRQHIKKQRHHFVDKGLSSQSYGFSSSHVWMWVLDHNEGWISKNCGVREDSWQPLGLQGRSNQSIIMKTNAEYSLEGLMLKLKLQYFGYLMRRADSLEKTLMLEKTEGKRGSGWQRMRWLDSIINSMHMNFEQIEGDSEGQQSLVCCSP